MQWLQAVCALGGGDGVLRACGRGGLVLRDGTQRATSPLAVKQICKSAVDEPRAPKQEQHRHGVTRMVRSAAGVVFAESVGVWITTGGGLERSTTAAVVRARLLQRRCKLLSRDAMMTDET